MTRTLFTIGHSNRTSDEFIALLQQNGVTAVADVRSQPYSRRLPQFNREALSSTLKGHGIAYVFLGDELGARRSELCCYENGMAKYDLIAKTPHFQSGLERIVEGSKTQTIALVCAEKDPITCHRMILIAKALVELNVQHIISSDCVETNDQSEQRLLACFKLDNDDFFSTQEERLQQAYDQQGVRIAYHREPQSQADSKGSQDA